MAFCSKLPLSGRLGGVGLAAFGALAFGTQQPALASSLTAEQALGKALFFDKTLSKNGTQACGSCHAPSAAFTDPDKNHPTSKGDNPSLFGNRNTPTVAYAAFSPEFHYDETEGLWVGGQFLDGRAPTLQVQAKGPFLNKLEMGNPSKSYVLNTLKNGSNAAAFKQVYGANIFDTPTKAYEKLATAIAAYERSSEVSPFTSKFDYYNKGQAKLTLKEQRGLAAFNDPMKGNCAACHISSPSDDGTPALFTDFTYDNIGIPKNLASDFLNLPTQFNPDGTSFVDLGLGGIVGDESLYGAFKVSTLRNVALTGPYGHNGWFDNLEDVVDFYATRDTKPVCTSVMLSSSAAVAAGCWPGAEFAEQMNVDELGNLPLNKWDKKNIVAFLGTLTDGYQAPTVPEPTTWALMLVGFGGIGAALRRNRKERLKIA
ncbi:PEPxxWA-CTERM sorting domain-containing protein [Sphingobium sp. DEHP117]|uniref:cytochrome c peroxidase n=1 Tax=Sphingobium sp. DEHP117 TaxID=2993436 RepID=UPI0027D6C964|nr:cytochrome c peroxidase [Sphingobium sp. DEHP117]MDQ4419165.1 PEPxxWA-CTERM sorting domain-containing protein [Sphingobium sp. DEHP117]